MKKTNIFFIILLTIVIGGWLVTRDSQSNTSQVENVNGVVGMNAVEFGELASQDETFVLDVHTPEQNHIPGTDAFIPYNDLDSHLDELPEDKNTPIAVYCRSGSMSKTASQELIDLGYTQVYDLIGGINAYKESHVSVEITPAVQELGTVVYGDVTTTEFTLTNFSPASLEITRLTTSCGCTKATMEKTTLDPYESALVKVTFDPAVHKDDTDLGELSRTIYLDTDNLNFPQLTADIRANVIKK